MRPTEGTDRLPVPHDGRLAGKADRRPPDASSGRERFGRPHLFRLRQSLNSPLGFFFQSRPNGRELSNASIRKRVLRPYCTGICTAFLSLVGIVRRRNGGSNPSISSSLSRFGELKRHETRDLRQTLRVLFLFNSASLPHFCHTQLVCREVEGTCFCQEPLRH